MTIKQLAIIFIYLFLIVLIIFFLVNSNLFAGFGRYCTDHSISNNCPFNSIMAVEEMNPFEFWIYCDANLDRNVDYVVVAMPGYGKNYDKYGAVLIYSRKEAEAFLECLVKNKCKEFDAMIAEEIKELEKKRTGE